MIEAWQITLRARPKATEIPLLASVYIHESSAFSCARCAESWADDILKRYDAIGIWATVEMDPIFCKASSPCADSNHQRANWRVEQ